LKNKAKRGGGSKKVLANDTAMANNQERIIYPAEKLHIKGNIRRGVFEPRLQNKTLQTN